VLVGGTGIVFSKNFAIYIPPFPRPLVGKGGLCVSSDLNAGLAFLLFR